MSAAVRRPRMTRDEFLAWVDTQDNQLKWKFDGFAPVAMNRPRVTIAATLFSRDTPDASWTATPVRAGETPHLPAIDVALPLDEIFASVDFEAS